MSASALVNLSGGDAVLQLVCGDFSLGTIQEWTVTDASAYALTFAT